MFSALCSSIFSFNLCLNQSSTYYKQPHRRNNTKTGLSTIDRSDCLLHLVIPSLFPSLSPTTIDDRLPDFLDFLLQRLPQLPPQLDVLNGAFPSCLPLCAGHAETQLRFSCRLLLLHTRSSPATSSPLLSLTLSLLEPRIQHRHHRPSHLIRGRLSRISGASRYRHCTESNLKFPSLARNFLISHHNSIVCVTPTSDCDCSLTRPTSTRQPPVRNGAPVVFTHSEIISTIKSTAEAPRFHVLNTGLDTYSPTV